MDVSESKNIRFRIIENEDEREICDICGLVNDVLLESNEFDVGEESCTEIHFCRSCIRNLDHKFEE